MSLGRATLAGRPVGPSGEPPFDTHDLRNLMGVPFDLPCEDDWVRQGGSRAHRYIEGAAAAWIDTPEWMDFLDLESPINDLKRAERDIYLHHWAAWLDAHTVMDVGCGIGRFTTAMLDRGADVLGVDADLDSLRRCAWHANNRAGRLDLHWTSVHNLPEAKVELIICAEVLCYVPRAREALAAMVERLEPGGTLLISVESRWAWATAPDAPPNTMAQALEGDGVLDLPGERWVRTYTREDLSQLLEGAGLRVDLIQPMLWMMDGPLERVMPESGSLEELIALEARCATHPVWAPLNRIWTAAATRA
jgi:2-polyprenyl-3-methyl-5-hydroxy-6-metoxy-1,4-benzoquinol methylase